MKKTAKAAALVAAVVLAVGLTACQKKDGAAASGAAQQPAGTAKAAKAAKPTPVNEFSRELTEDAGGVRILKYNGSAKSVVIPTEIEGLPVKEIDKSAFYDNTTLKSVTIPDSVEKIGKSAFMNCESLTSVIIPDSVEKIDEFVLCNCTALKSVTFGNSVQAIGNEAFDGCKSLKSVTLGNSVQEIGYAAFYNCTALQSLTIPDSLQKIKFVVRSYDGKNNAFKETELPLATQARLKALGYTDSF
ncbi:MAG: leucine-rich repeat domain-containing protein [Treponema sp.]|nr:leucine-rich repeat domain-containing protein [Treponema sp.]